MKKKIGLVVTTSGSRGWVKFDKYNQQIPHREFFPSGFWPNGDLEWFYNGLVRLRAGSTYEQAKALEDSSKDNV